MKPINIGILGLGTVGKGTVNVLQDNAAEISRRLGRDVKVFMVSTRHADKAREFCPADTIITTNPFDIVKHADVDIVVELFGGTELAKDLVLKPFRMVNILLPPIKNYWLNTAMRFFHLLNKKM